MRLAVYFLKLSEPWPFLPIPTKKKQTDRTTNLKNQNLPRIYTRKLDDYVSPQTSEKRLIETASRETPNFHHQPIGKHRLLIWNSTELSECPAGTNLLVLKQSRTQKYAKRRNQRSLKSRVYLFIFISQALNNLEALETLNKVKELMFHCPIKLNKKWKNKTIKSSVQA